MKTALSAAALVSLFVALPLAEGRAQSKSTCDMQADQQKLTGAAKTSFVAKCRPEAGTVCDKAAADQKIATAARAAHRKQCMTDAGAN